MSGPCTTPGMTSETSPDDSSINFSVVMFSRFTCAQACLYMSSSYITVEQRRYNGCIAYHDASVRLTPAWYACSSLCYQSEKDLEVSMQAAGDAGVTVVSLPLVNQWTQVSPCSKIARLLSILVLGIPRPTATSCLFVVSHTLYALSLGGRQKNLMPCKQHHVDLLLLSHDPRPSQAGSLTQPAHADVSSVSVCRTGTSRGSAPPNGGG